MARLGAFLLAASLVSAIGAPAVAAEQPATRVVKCGAHSCLLVSGSRDWPGAKIAINGHEVRVEGARSWRARVPVATIRAWSEPYARTLAVSVAGASQDVVLPIGLLGHAEDLAMLVIRVK